MVLLIKQSDLSKSTPLGGNIDEAKYIPAVKSAQLTSIKPILGNELYNKLVLDFSTDSLTGDYKILYDEYVKPMLVHLGASYYLTTGAYQIDNRGITKHQTDNATPINKEEVDYIVKQQEKMYEFYKREFYRNIKSLNVPEYVENSRVKGAKKIGGWIVGSNKCTPKSIQGGYNEDCEDEWANKEF